MVDGGIETVNRIVKGLSACFQARRSIEPKPAIIQIMKVMNANTSDSNGFAPKREAVVNGFSWIRILVDFSCFSRMVERAKFYFGSSVIRIGSLPHYFE
jgi:hypothetical protein